MSAENDTSDQADSTGDELDLSDEAFWDWDEQFNRLHMDTSFSQHALDGWQEARRRGLLKYDDVMKCWNESIDDKNRELDTLREAARRCEARLDVQAQQHIEILAKVMADNVRLIIEKKKLEEQMKERDKP